MCTSLAVRRQRPNSDRTLKMDRVDFLVLKWNSRVQLPVLPVLFLNFLQQPFNGEFFLDTLLMNDYGINVDKAMTSHIVFQESVILPDSKLKSHSFFKEIIRKIFSVEWPLQKVKKKKKKSVMTGSRTRNIPLKQLERDVVYSQGPVRIQPLPSYCKETIRCFASLCPPWKRPCINSGTILCT